MSNERLGYRAIADRLNEDLDRYPPPVPVDPARAVGHWTHSSVRDVLTNPKYTGFMVWNRRATKDKLHPGKNNPRDEWIMSSEPEHPELVSVERFLEAQAVPTCRERSRSDADPAAPNRHRETKTVYRLRSYVHYIPCQRRMHGKTSRHGHAFSYCQPRGRAIPDGHPATVAVREEALLAAVTEFFNTHVFGRDRIDLAQAGLPAATEHVRNGWERKAATLRRHVHEIEPMLPMMPGAPGRKTTTTFGTAPPACSPRRARGSAVQWLATQVDPLPVAHYDGRTGGAVPQSDAGRHFVEFSEPSRPDQQDTFAVGPLPGDALFADPKGPSIRPASGILARSGRMTVTSIPGLSDPGLGVAAGGDSVVATELGVRVSTAPPAVR